MKTMILSAFGQFGAYGVNSTELVARKLHGTKLAGVAIQSIVFPCLIPQEDRGRVLFDLALDLRAAGIICLGMSSEKKGLCVESVTRNVVDSKYCDSHINGTVIDPELPVNHELFIDLVPWNIDIFGAKCMEQGLGSIEVSVDPGAFCCNHLLFQLKRLQVNSLDLAKVPFIFVHVPCSREAVVDLSAHHNAGKITMSIGQVIQGIGILIKNSSSGLHS